MTGRRRVSYVAVLLLCGGALIVDRYVGAPVGTPAGALGAEYLSLADSARGGDAAAQSGIPELPFPHEVARFAASVPRRDFFTPPKRHQSQVADGGGTSDTTDTPNSHRSGNTAKEFEGNHEVLGILIHQEIRVVIVNGAWVRVGESVDGCTLAEIMGKRVLFECHDGVATIELAHASGNGRG